MWRPCSSTARPFGIVIGVLVLAGCGGGRTSEISTALEQLLDGRPIVPAGMGRSAGQAVWKDVGAFYAGREGRPAWVVSGGMREAREALDVLRSAPEHGFSAENYELTGIEQALSALEDADDDSEDRPGRLAALDAKLTSALLAFGRDVALGRSAPAGIDRKARREPLDFAATLSAAAGGDLSAWVQTIRPRHPEYAALQDALRQLRGQLGKGGWPAVPVATFKPGQSNAAVVALRKRLAASGYLEDAEGANESPVYDADVENGVKAFQNLHALPATGIADRPTLAAMNVPIEDRIAQVAVNLERWRRAVDDFGPRHLLVNIPYFHLIAREDGKPVMDIRVVVGTVTNKTPVFSSQMSTVVFSPYWNIPDSIVEGETAPAVARDPNYLVRNGIDILRPSRSGAQPVDADSVDWDDPEELQQLAFRQRPGAGNALGHVKFLFPNPFNVYLHDTPSDQLFARPGRAFSHGCVRVEEPETLAKYVLRGHDEWDEPRILEAMKSGNEKAVKLNEPIPVHLVYFTAWVDDKGGLHFQPDVYGYDGI